MRFTPNTREVTEGYLADGVHRWLSFRVLGRRSPPCLPVCRHWQCQAAAATVGGRGVAAIILNTYLLGVTCTKFGN